MKRIFDFRAWLSIMAVVLCVTSCFPDDFYNPLDDPQKEQPQNPSLAPKPEPDPVPEPQPVPERLYVPEIRINVENGRNVYSKDEYLNMNLYMMKDGVSVMSASGRIKGRGNATWGYEKKPYKIKFDQKQDMLGHGANKDWVLLADYCDKSLMRTPYMCELAQTVGLPYPIHYRHVQLYLNEEYVGLYVLTDQVEKKKGRVDIEDDGFLFEHDNYFWDEPLNFMTDHRGYWYTFKYPDPEDGKIAEGDDNFNYIVRFMNDFEAALYSDDFKDPEKGYRKYIDVKSFAKWFLVQELTANLEPNMYYVLPTRGAKLQLAPVWDAEWSMGLAYREDEYAGWAGLPTQPDRYQAIWSKWKYFGRLFEDEYFVNVVRNEWEDFQIKIPAFKEKMGAVSENISEEQVMNFDRWRIMDWHVSVGLISLGTWEKEVGYVDEFFADRADWLGHYLAGIRHDLDREEE